MTSVTNITGVPTTATVGVALTLTGTVVPATATYQTIVWSIVNAGTTGATISGNESPLSSDARLLMLKKLTKQSTEQTLSTTAAGTVTVRATIANGTDKGNYMQDFKITVAAASRTRVLERVLEVEKVTPISTPAHVAVTNITGVPATATAGTSITLTGTVVPTTATNKTIVWSMASAGTTGATISGSSLSVKSAGTVSVLATVANGASAKSNYTQSFPIKVESNVLTLSKSVAKVKESFSGTLTVSSGNTSGQTITWSSDDTSIVTIISSSGNYTGKKKGIANITAKTADGTKKGSCKMYVYKDITSALGKGIDILNADTVTTDFIKTNNPVIDIDMLNVEGNVKQDVFLKTEFKHSISDSVVNVVDELNKKSNVGYNGAFTASVETNYNTKKTESKTTKFIKAAGTRSIRSEAIVNTQMNYLKAYLTDQFRSDCASKTAATLLNVYGSHVIAECCWGGIALVDAMYTSTKVTSNSKLEAIVKASFGKFSADNTTVSTKEKDHFKKNTVETIKAWGGNISATTWDDFSNKYDNWYKSLENYPDVCGIKTFNENTTMLPLWKFINEVSPAKAKDVEALFKTNCSKRGVALKGLQVYVPVLTDINVFANSKSNSNSIPSPYNRVVLSTFANSENDAESFADKKDDILDTNKSASGSYVNIFYTASQVPNMNAYAGRAISDIIVLNGEKAKVPSGYSKIGVDLNHKAGGDYLWLAYKKATTSTTETVIDFVGGAVYSSSQLPGLPAKDDGTWHWVYEYNSSGSSTGNVADLNKGVGKRSSYIRLLVHKIAKQKDPT